MQPSQNEGVDNIYQKLQIPNWYQIEIYFCEYSCRLIGIDCRKRLSACQSRTGLVLIGLAGSLRHLIEQINRSAPKFAPNCGYVASTRRVILLICFVIQRLEWWVACDSNA